MISRKNWNKYNITLTRGENDFEPDFENPKDTEWVVKQLKKGNEWAWCSTHVHVTCKGTGISADDHLFGCAYHSREDFMRPGGYYDDMVSGCIHQIEEEKSRLREALKHC